MAARNPAHGLALFFSPRSLRSLPVFRRHLLDRIAVEIVPHRALDSAGRSVGPRVRKDLDLGLVRRATPDQCGARLHS
jgi:hypothetical protein